MHVSGIVVARLDSSRLPGKALIEVGGIPLLEHVLTRAARIPGLGDLVLATSERAVDDPLADYAAGHDLPVFRGSTRDVAGRLLACAKSRGADYFIRLNGDSPCPDPELIGRGLTLCADGRPDFVTNLISRTFPYGVSVEIVRVASYAALYPRFEENGDREHVTSYLYRHAANLDIRRLVSHDPALAGVRLVVDTPEDLNRFRRLLEAVGPDFLTADTACLAGHWRSLFQPSPREPEP